MSQRILVVVETKGGHIRKVTFEAVAAARCICTEGTVTAVCFGIDQEKHIEALAHYGADEVVLVPNEQLQSYTTDGYRQALIQVIEELKPHGIIAGHTAQGKDLAPRIAAKLGVGLISDCTAVEMIDNSPVFTRPIYAGKAFHRKAFNDPFFIATIRPNNIEALKNDEPRTAKTRIIPVELTDLRTTIKNVVKKTSGKVDLSEARIIVSGGRGVKSADGFKPLEELAEVLGAAVGASRGACDAGYCDYSLQIGQTGKVVTPDLYIACGISGAIQHLAGMSNSKVIVAINKDPDADIFKVSDYGIVGDLFEVVPMLTEEFKKLMAR